MRPVDGKVLLCYHGHMTMVTSDNEARVPAGQFKARCLSLIDEVSQTHRAITITKRGRPVARLVPLPVEKPQRVFGLLAGHVAEEGDIVSPTGERWEVEGG